MLRRLLVALVVAMSGMAQAEEVSGVVVPHPQHYFEGSPQKNWPVTRIPVKVGDWVEAGQILVELDPAKLPQQEAAAKMLAAEHHVTVLTEKQKYKQKCFERWVRLAATGASSQQEGDERSEDLQALACEIKCATAQQKAASVALAREKYDFDHYQVIPALISGEVIEISCAIGMVVRAQAGQVVWVKVLDDSKVQIKCTVPSAKGLALRSRSKDPKKPQEPFKIVGKKVTAKLVAIPKIIHKGNMEVLLEADNPNGELTVGDEVKVSF